MIREEEKKNSLAVKVADKLIKNSSLTVQSHYHRVNKTIASLRDSNFPTLNGTSDDDDDDNNNNNQGTL